MLTNEQMPAPDALVCNADGFVWPAMFHYAPSEDEDAISDILAEHSYEISGYHMRDDHPLMAKYEQGENVIGEWQPQTPPGWQFAGKHDTDDGPYVFFLRKLENPPAAD